MKYGALAALCMSTACLLGLAACSFEGTARELDEPPGTGGSGASQQTTSTGGSFVDEGETLVGQTCVDAVECGDHENNLCVTADDNVSIFTRFWGGDELGGGVANGYCTRACDIDTPCPSGSTCGDGVCLALCDFGSPDLPSLDATLDSAKCHGRSDLMCVPSAAGEAVCMPNCGAEADACGARACDGRFGVCLDPDRDGDSVGAACVVDNASTDENEDSCAGLCLEIVDQKDRVMATVCSSRCSMGGDDGDCGGPDEGVCAIPRLEEGGQSQLGDVGFCASACEQHDACAFGSGIFCVDLGNYDDNGKGYCVQAESCDGMEPCSDGRACTETAAGSYCLDDDGAAMPLFPLGEAAL